MDESQGDRKHVAKRLEEISGNVKSLMGKPANRYDMVVASVLTAVIGDLVGFSLSGVFPIQETSISKGGTKWIRFVINILSNPWQNTPTSKRSESGG